MKKIVISAVIRPTDDAVTLNNLKKSLCQFGQTEFVHDVEILLGNAERPELTEVMWLYATADESEPYFLVKAPGNMKGEELATDEVGWLIKHGVCVEFRAQYPRADYYGAPSYATNDVFAEGIVAHHGFRVAQQGLDVYAEDRGDDGGEEIWLKILAPKRKPATKLQKKKRR